jgi:cell division protein FtsL
MNWQLIRARVARVCGRRKKSEISIKEEREMTDWVNGIEKRNYGIKKKNGVISRDMFLNFFLLFLIAGSLIFHLWVRGQITYTGYRIQELSRLEESLMRTNEKLIVREGALQSPERIDRIARDQLGMAPMRPEQVLLPRPPYVPMDRSVMAMANNYP